MVCHIWLAYGPFDHRRPSLDGGVQATGAAVEPCAALAARLPAGGERCLLRHCGGCGGRGRARYPPDQEAGLPRRSAGRRPASDSSASPRAPNACSGPVASHCSRQCRTYASEGSELLVQAGGAREYAAPQRSGSRPATVGECPGRETRTRCSTPSPPATLGLPPRPPTAGSTRVEPAPRRCRPAAHRHRPQHRRHRAPPRCDTALTDDPRRTGDPLRRGTGGSSRRRRGASGITRAWDPSMSKSTRPSPSVYVGEARRLGPRRPRPRPGRHDAPYPRGPMLG